MAWRRHRRALVAIVAAIALAGLSAFAWQSPAVRKQITESVARQSTPYTELYFTDHTNLPSFLSTSYTNDFAVSIGNHEGKAVSYPYQVTAKSAQGTTKVSSGAVEVGSGRVVSTSISFLAPAPALQYVITVQLLGRPEMIHFAATS
jgi:hypothetical protein